MRHYTPILLAALLLTLTACGTTSSDRPVYSGHEESTAGVPGWTPDGKRKLHPNIKLGQSYRVSGVTYVPRYQPDYDEEGMASWYGPGFHGGKTANGERYNMSDHTAAHTTLPLPSIVKVTYLKTGRSSYARINDRGPFAHGRIIDLSKAVAEEIGLTRDGVGKVRVEYMSAESAKFIDMITHGRDPQSIDIASEIIGQAPEVQYAETSPADESVQMSDIAPPPSTSVWQQLNPIPSAAAAEPTVMVVPPTQAVLLPPTEPTPVPTPAVIAVAPPPAQAVLVPVAPMGDALYVQLGAFSQQANAAALGQRFSALGESNISPAITNGTPIYRVRLGPFLNEEAATEMLERAEQMGVADARLITEHH